MRKRSNSHGKSVDRRIDNVKQDSEFGKRVTRNDFYKIFQVEFFCFPLKIF